MRLENNRASRFANILGHFLRVTTIRRTLVQLIDFFSFLNTRTKAL